MCLCEGLEENLVLQIQSVPPAVWTPLYQSAFYVLITLAIIIIIIIINSMAPIIITVVIINIIFPPSMSVVNVFYMCLIFNLTFCVCFLGSQQSFCTECDCLLFLFTVKPRCLMKFLHSVRMYSFSSYSY